MGDVSEIARRMPDGSVQYGWSGNGGYYSGVGWRLLEWYDDPEIIDYLFGLGQLKLIGKPHSEKDPDAHWFEKTQPSDAWNTEPHYIGKSENDVWDKIAFVDHIYFWDSDNRWYYIDSIYLNVKIPLWYIANNIDEEKRYDEFNVCADVRKRLAEYIIGDYLASDPKFGEYLSKWKIDPKTALENPTVDAVYDLLERVQGYFDPWAVVLTDEEDENVTGFIVRKKSGQHIETNKWKPKKPKKIG